MNRVLAAVPIVSGTGVRRFATSQIKNVKPDLTKIKEKQALFQANNDLPVHLKGGTGDVILYYVTCAMTFAGLAMSVHSLYKLSCKK